MSVGCAAVMVGLAAVGASDGTWPVIVAGLEQHERRVALGWGVFNLAVVVVVVLMAFKPGA
ncbi:MAG TPA: hypothetical protein VMW49_01145 [Candidatus Dormibacteraeota bacterium]|nr:hypothetical protein [Candidatus Dormibacteraeota bacterium]